MKKQTENIENLEKGNKMTAVKALNEAWFMVIRTHKWYQKKRSGNTYTEAYQIGSKKKYLIPNNEPVIIRK